tara:strand:+ start:1418 stop:1843 length:426 start_codon:yes stop_codon:yes gene_type:complete
MDFISNSEQETIGFAFNFSKKVKKGSIIALIGNMGSGKTIFAKGFAKGLSINEHVGSPTFKIVSEYKGKPFDLYHIDTYRLDGPNDFIKIGGEEYIYQQTGITMIEWADLIEDILPINRITITFKRLEKTESRFIQIDGII